MRFAKFIVFSILVLVLNIGISFAQAPPPNNPPSGAPLDGLVAGLIAVSVSYGYMKTKKAK